MSSHNSPMVQGDLQLLGARVSTKGSQFEIAANPFRGDDADDGVPTMGFYCWIECVIPVYCD